MSDHATAVARPSGPMRVDIHGGLQVRADGTWSAERGVDPIREAEMWLVGQRQRVRVVEEFLKEATRS